MSPEGPESERAVPAGAPDPLTAKTADAERTQTAQVPLPDGPLQKAAPTFDRRYRIVRELGAGGYGTVYLVQDTLNADEEIALKLIRSDRLGTPDVLKRFKNEIRTMRALNHPGIPQIYNDGLTEAGEFYYTMAFVRGRSLSDVIRADAPLAPDRVARIAKQMLDVLDYAHRRGVVHRDLKPGNVILVDPGGEREQVKVLDFGIAKLLAREGELENALTMNTEAAIGTPHYMAPEQVRGKEVDGRTDLYALGIIIYQMCTGKMPFSGNTVMEILSARLEQDPTPLVKGQVPEWLDSLVMRLLEREREKRPTAEVVLTQLQEVARGQHALGKQLRWVAGGVVVLGVALAWMVFGKGGAREPEGQGQTGNSEPKENPGPSNQKLSGTNERERSEQLGSEAARPKQEEEQSSSVPTADVDRSQEPRPAEKVEEPPPSASNETPPPARVETDDSRVADPGHTPASRPSEPALRLPSGCVAVAGSQRDSTGHPLAIRHERTGIELVLVPAEGSEAAFYIGKTEVSWAVFERIMQRDPAKRHDFDQAGFDRSTLDEHPAIQLDFEEAQRFCASTGFTLPTREQWVRAAGGIARAFPFGAGPAQGVANLTGTGGDDTYEFTAPCGAMKGDVSPLGVFDLGGNVREWCREGAGITVSGGSWSSDEGAARVDFTPRRRPGGGGDDKTGFRVVMEVAE